MRIAKNIYRLPDDSLRRLAHTFVSDNAPSTDMNAVRRALSSWVRVHWRSHLVFAATPAGGWLLDTRPCRGSVLRRLAKDEAAVYQFCRDPRPLSAVCVHLRMEERRAGSILAEFVRDRAMLGEGGLYLSLAVEPSRDYRWFRQTEGADISSRFPLSETLALTIQMGLGRRGSALAVRRAAAVKLTSRCLTVRWRLASGAGRLIAAVLGSPAALRRSNRPRIA